MAVPAGNNNCSHRTAVVVALRCCSSSFVPAAGCFNYPLLLVVGWSVGAKRRCWCGGRQERGVAGRGTYTSQHQERGDIKELFSIVRKSLTVFGVVDAFAGYARMAATNMMTRRRTEKNPIPGCSTVLFYCTYPYRVLKLAY